MKYIKLFLFLCLFTTFIIVECFQDSRVKRILHKSHKHKAEKATFQARFATFLNIGAQFQQRDKSISIFDDVRAKINRAWQLLVADGTEQAAIQRLQQEINDLYSRHLTEPQNAAASKQKQIQDEQRLFQDKFLYAMQYDQLNEKYIAERRQVEQNQTETEANATLTADQKQTQIESFERRKHELNLLILKGEGEVHRILTDFLYPLKDQKAFNRNVIKAIESSMPENFCYRQLAETSLNVQCPSDTPNYHMGFCQESCEQGQGRLGIRPNGKFNFVAGVCWETCDTQKQPRCETHLLNVYPNGRSLRTLFDTHLKDSFIPKSRTHFSQHVTCPPGQVKWGALCYTESKQCSEYGYERCVTSAFCALNSQECKDVIKDMVVSTITGLAKFSLLFVAPGAGQIITLTSSIVQALSGLEGLLSSMLKQRQALKTISSRDILKNKLIRDVVEFLESKQQNQIGTETLGTERLRTDVQAILGQQITKIDEKKSIIQSITSSIRGGNAIDKAKQATEGTLQLADYYSTAKGLYDASTEVATALKSASETTTAREVVQEHFQDVVSSLGSGGSALDVIDQVVFDVQLAKNAYDLVVECKKDYSNLECKKALVGVAAVFDPTGLLGIAKAFMYNKCQEP